MTDLPDRLFRDPAWHALHGYQRHLGVRAGDACRYRADVAPFAAVASQSATAMRDLSRIVQPGERVWMFGKPFAAAPEFEIDQTLSCLQMIFPEEAAIGEPQLKVVPLTAADAPDMVTLTDLAFPGFFRANTYVMGCYHGVRSEGQLIAMGGQRLCLDRYFEVSGVCTHPAHRGKGLATRIIQKLLDIHRRAQRVSWLHVGVANRGAISIYSHLGFRTVRDVQLKCLVRTPK